MSDNTFFDTSLSGYYAGLDATADVSPGGNCFDEDWYSEGLR